MPLNVFVISHTHWDREWYQTFQELRILLVTMMDGLLDILAHDSDYRCFMVDGYSLVLEDYLQIRPEREPDIRDHVREGRLLLGPWYVLPDEYLVSPESLIRNLMMGDRLARRYGEPMAVSYIPDSFGHISQLPQILSGFGIQDVAIWRGVPDLPTEFLWRAPDGSTVLVVYLRDGYGNLGRAPQDPAGFTQAVRQAVDSLAPHSTTQAVLLMDGADHTEPCSGLPALITDAQERLPDLRLSHGSLAQYVTAIRAAAPALRTVEGEFRSPQRSTVLPGVLSSRMWIKQRNGACETFLERWAEPFSAFAALVQPNPLAPSSTASDESRNAFVQYAWSLLLKNHPHDSICGCSADQVHEEMRVRFDQVSQIAEQITHRSLMSLSERITTSRPKARRPKKWVGSEAGAVADHSRTQAPLIQSSASDLLRPAPYLPIVVFNPCAGPRTDLVLVQVQLPPAWPGFELVDERDERLHWQELSEEKIDSSLLGIDGSELLTRLPKEQPGRVGEQGIARLRYQEADGEPLVLVTLGAHGRPSPLELKTAISEIQRRVHAVESARLGVQVEVAPLTSLAFVAPDVPGHGYRVFFLQPSLDPPPRGTIVRTPRLENEYYVVEADPTSGAINLHDKNAGIVYQGLNRFLDEGDRGDCYNYCPVEQDTVVGDPARPPVIRLLETGPARQTLEIALHYSVPAGLAISRRARLARRVTMPITTRVSLLPGIPRVDFETTVNNTARDHRLRVCFPTPIKADAFRTETPFDVIERPLDLPVDTLGWPEQPAPTHPQRTFSNVCDNRAGMTLMSRGLPETEAQRLLDGTALLLTLLRCVGWLSRDDLPVRPGPCGPGISVPGAQCLGAHTFHYALALHGRGWKGVGWLSTLAQAHAFTAPMRALVANPHLGPLPAVQSFVEVSPSTVVVSAVKLTETGDGLVVRIWNAATGPVEARLQLRLPFNRVSLTDLNERARDQLSPGVGDAVRIPLLPRQVKTVCLE